MNQENRDTLIDDCVAMTAELEGIPEDVINRVIFELMDDEGLLKEHQWLYEMVYLK